MGWERLPTKSWGIRASQHRGYIAIEFSHRMARSFTGGLEKARLAGVAEGTLTINPHLAEQL